MRFLKKYRFIMNQHLSSIDLLYKENGIRGVKANIVIDPINWQEYRNLSRKAKNLKRRHFKATYLIYQEFQNYKNSKTFPLPYEENEIWSSFFAEEIQKEAEKNAKEQMNKITQLINNL